MDRKPRPAASVSPPDPGLTSISVQDPVVLVLAQGVSTSDAANTKGHLFEQFVALLLSRYGYEDPTVAKLNVSVDGIELDVTAAHRLTREPALAECKAYTAPVRAESLAAFYGKLALRRYADPRTHGFFIALPRLTADGHQEAQRIAANDPKFTLMTANEVVHALSGVNEIAPMPVQPGLTSDPAVLITEHGIFSACVELHEATRTPARVLVWGARDNVPPPVLELVANHDYAQGVAAVDAREPRSAAATHLLEHEAAVVVPVMGSNADFEYQLPASPRFFVGRKAALADLSDAVGRGRAVIVLNAQSGWGKSSLALRLQRLIEDRKGYALVVDSRTASAASFVTAVLRRAAVEAERAGLMKLPSGASWASVASALRTLQNAEWSSPLPVLVFFDQFENIFRNGSLTREFRDLALGAQDLGGRLMVGFAWKTDLVGWTEGHPYQFRDEIRANATVVTLGPLGPPEVETLLRRLERELHQRLARELRQRLREYSQGLPWLLKKLAGHVLREIRTGATQEQLVSEALNVQNLFEADLAELTPGEQEGLRYVARFAPVPVSEVLDRFSADMLQSLLDRRLVVQVGERLDTYWDIFRDYLNTGRVPVEDSYIIRQSPHSVGRLLREVLSKDGNRSVPDIALAWQTSENVVFNLGRELRLLGVAGFEPNRVRIIDEVMSAPRREEALRLRVASALHRHRAYSVFSALAERTGDRVSIGAYAKELPNAFPAVEVADKTWQVYARAFVQWFEYAGLARAREGTWSVANEPEEGAVQLLDASLRRRGRGMFGMEPAGPSLELLEQLAGLPNATINGPLHGRWSGAARSLEILGVVHTAADGTVRLMRMDLVRDGRVAPEILLEVLGALPANRMALKLLADNPAASSAEVGAVIRDASGADWGDATMVGVGKYFRGWARAAGVRVEGRGHRSPATSLGQRAVP
jgi:hypothetical protein